MPIYEYKCEKCSHEFECLCRTHDDAVVCAYCGSLSVKRLISKSNLQFKGSGWTPKFHWRG